MENLVIDIRNISIEKPKEGQLYIVFLPIAHHKLTGKVIGPSTTAYYRKNQGWIHADKPNHLQFNPAYWIPISFKGE